MFFVCVLVCIVVIGFVLCKCLVFVLDIVGFDSFKSGGLVCCRVSFISFRWSKWGFFFSFLVKVGKYEVEVLGWVIIKLIVKLL